MDERLNPPPTNENDSVNFNCDPTLAPDLQRRLMLSQNSQKNDDLSIEEEIEFYENELGSRFLACTLTLISYRLYHIVYVLCILF